MCPPPRSHRGWARLSLACHAHVTSSLCVSRACDATRNVGQTCPAVAWDSILRDSAVDLHQNHGGGSRAGLLDGTPMDVAPRGVPGPSSRFRDVPWLLVSLRRPEFRAIAPVARLAAERRRPCESGERPSRRCLPEYWVLLTTPISPGNEAFDHPWLHSGHCRTLRTLATVKPAQASQDEEAKRHG